MASPNPLHLLSLPRLLPLAALLCAAALDLGCASSTEAFGVRRLRDAVRVDGRLEEPCYDHARAIAGFKVASRPGAQAPETRAWLFWDETGLHFAFSASDTSIVSAQPSAAEHAVDAQDRVEIFLWPEGSERYFSIEIAPDGAVHDYAARLYRRFDDAWTPPGSMFAARRTEAGYAAEGFLPVGALQAMGIGAWGPGTRFEAGLFRADFRPGAPDDPLWLTWVEPGLPEPDFHVRAAFAAVELEE